MKKILTCLFTILMIVSLVLVCSAAPETGDKTSDIMEQSVNSENDEEYIGPPEVKADSAVMASLTSDQIIYSKNSDGHVAPAEFTKLMAAYTTYKLYGFDTEITVSDSIFDYTDYRDASMKLKSGEQIKSGDLIRGMLVEQANDAVYAVSLNYGSMENFVAKMNEYARELGMTNTVFTNATGKEDANQHTTANDLLKLYKAFYKDKNLYSVISEKNVTIPATNLSGERTYWTKNHLMSRFIYVDYLYDNATAGVSSSTTFGGYSVISTAVDDEREFVCVVLNSVKEDNVNYAMIDAQNLFEHAFDDFKTVDLVKLGDLLYESDVKNGKDKDTLLLCANKSMKAEIMKTDDISAIKKEVKIKNPVEAPIKKGDVIGTVLYTYNGNIIGEINLVAEQNVEKSFMKSVFGGIGWFFGLTIVKVVLFLLIAGFVLMVVMAYIRAKKRRNRRRNRRRNYKKF